MHHSLLYFIGTHFRIFVRKFLVHVCVFPTFRLFESLLTLSLLRVINVKIPLQPHKKYDITQHGELDFHSLLRWKVIILQILATSLIQSLFERLGEYTFWAQEWKGYCAGSAGLLLQRGVCSILHNGWVRKWEEDCTRALRLEVWISALSSRQMTVNHNTIFHILGCLSSCKCFLLHISKKKLAKAFRIFNFPRYKLQQVGFEFDIFVHLVFAVPYSSWSDQPNRLTG